MKKQFKIVLHKRAFKELRSLSSNIRDRIIKSLKEMELDPFRGDVKPLKGLKGAFRRRVGAFRIIFTIDFEEGVIVVLRIGSRERVYR